MGEIFLLLGLILMSALFSSSETAITSLSRLKLNRMLSRKAPSAKILKTFKDNPSNYLPIILIGNNLANVASSAVATSMIMRFFSSQGWTNMGVAVGVSTGLMTFLVLTFGEIIPKTVAIRRAEQLSALAAPLILFLGMILKPVAYFLGFISRPFIVLLGGKAPEKGPFMTEDDIRMILATGEKEGVIEEEERQMITSIFEFGDTVAREVMTPRPDITALEVNKSLEDIVRIILDSGHSRIPVYEGNLDNIVGMVYAKDLLSAKSTTRIKDILRPVTFIPETKKVSELLHEMQAARTHLAVIVDEHGVASGLVTLEDLVEEIVGEIHDEFERDEKMFERVDNNTVIVDGRVTIKDLNDELKLNLPERHYDTIGGFVFGQLGKVPSVGNSVRCDDLLISVERIHRRRITRVKIAKLPGGIAEDFVGG
ncbi:hemolysin family protein [Candidatus Margulisiibacteriota bacterium]